MKKILILVTFLAGLAVLQSCSSGGGNDQSRKVIVVTLDGMRWQEVFRGADSTLLLSKEFTKDTAEQFARFWASDPATRREKIFPFLWGTVATNGQLYGNR
ncbi:MAG: phosphoglyceromutase, partial [Bacteroidota bacterium]